jgi:response regulator NasT
LDKNLSPSSRTVARHWKSCATRLPELVLMDYAMPHVNGAEAARHIWERHRIPVVMISGYADTDAVQASGEAGAIGYLIKPVGATDLGPAIEIAIQRARDLREARAKADDLEIQLRDRKLIERAKGVIMQRQHVTEEAAYRTLQRESRNQRRRMADLAQSVLSAQEILA